jgi:hypothetical protein
MTLVAINKQRMESYSYMPDYTIMAYLEQFKIR